MSMTSLSRTFLTRYKSLMMGRTASQSDCLVGCRGSGRGTVEYIVGIWRENKGGKEEEDEEL